MDITIVTTAHDRTTVARRCSTHSGPFKKGAEADNEPRKKKTRGPYGGKKKK
jgi:hypothetical protein